MINFKKAFKKKSKLTLALTTRIWYNNSCVVKLSGDDGEEVTPVPIPNTEVKFFSADGSRGLPPVRVGRRQAFTAK